MKIRVRRPGARERALLCWHRWFAWRPVRTGTNSFHWLCMVERKAYRCLTFEYSFPTYRLDWRHRARGAVTQWPPAPLPLTEQMKRWKAARPAFRELVG